MAHRQEILEQSVATFRNVLRDGKFGELWVGSSGPKESSFGFYAIMSHAQAGIVAATQAESDRITR